MRLYSNAMSSDLAILNAEHFIGTARIHMPGKASSRVKTAHSAHPYNGPRKRPKRATVTVPTTVDENEDNHDVEEKLTRARGRPRLDTKDQSAADVR